MGWFKFYISYIVNYSLKAVCVTFALTNKKGELKESGGYFVPKKAIKEINLKEKTITVAGWWYSLYGFIWRYRVDRAPGPPPKLEHQDSFNPNSFQYKHYPMSSVEGINIVQEV
ncbi:MAG: hypothetical protein ACFE9L_18945 [Candidatus Hodarchaeota archaeon]